jgi:hypothetical protein
VWDPAENTEGEFDRSVAPTPTKDGSPLEHEEAVATLDAA